MKFNDKDTTQAISLVMAMDSDWLKEFKRTVDLC